jgi:hypothetical protein
VKAILKHAGVRDLNVLAAMSRWRQDPEFTRAASRALERTTQQILERQFGTHLQFSEDEAARQFRVGAWSIKPLVEALAHDGVEIDIFQGYFDTLATDQLSKMTRYRTFLDDRQSAIILLAVVGCVAHQRGDEDLLDTVRKAASRLQSQPPGVVEVISDAGREVSSITPFSARALDRGFAGALVGLARHAVPQLTPPQGVELITDVRAAVERRLLDAFLERVRRQPFADEAEREECLRSVQNRIVELLDSWRRILEDYRVAGVSVQYQKYELKQPRPLLREMLDKNFESDHHRKFRANRSLRDVEPEVNLFLKDLSGMQVEDGS